MKKIGIIGGTFDPIHVGHLMIAESALDTYELDGVAFMPTGVSPHKGNIMDSTLNQRVEMVELAIKDNPKFYLSREEIDSDDEVCYTYKTLTRLNEKNPDTEFYFIMGGDSLNDFYTWRNPEIISKQAVLLVAVRDNMDGELFEESMKECIEHFQCDMRPLKSPSVSISSSNIRKRVANGESIRYIVPDSVWKYIQENELYLKR